MGKLIVGTRTFTNLKEVHDWAWETRPRSVLINATGTIEDNATRWNYSCPGGLIIKGGRWQGYGSKGWWLAYTPYYTSGGVKVNGVEVSGYLAGGLSGAASIHGSTIESGEKVWLRRVSVINSRFTDLAGLGAVYCQGVKYLEVRKSEFIGIGPMWTAHAVYANDATEGYIRDSYFENVAGDPVRARDGSRLAVVRSKSVLSGRNGLASTWTKPGERPSHITIVNSQAYKTYDNHKAVPLTDIRGKSETS